MGFNGAAALHEPSVGQSHGQETGTGRIGHGNDTNKSHVYTFSQPLSHVRFDCLFSIM